MDLQHIIVYIYISIYICVSLICWMFCLNKYIYIYNDIHIVIVYLFVAMALWDHSHYKWMDSDVRKLMPYHIWIIWLSHPLKTNFCQFGLFCQEVLNITYDCENKRK